MTDYAVTNPATGEVLATYPTATDAEVEAALAGHPDVMDVVVCGRPSERWGNEVVAVVQLREGADVTTDALEAEAERHVARYKLPKAYVFREQIQRSPSGKADYRWAKAQALDES